MFFLNYSRLNAVRAFVASQLGPVFIDIPDTKYAEVIVNVQSSTTILIIASPGMDVNSSVQQFAKLANVNVESMAVGQGQFHNAIRLIEKCARNGSWFFISNCHLSITWLVELEKEINKLKKLPIHESFRLILSSDPTTLFPNSLLQNSLKLVLEQPKGLKNTMLALYNNFNEKDFSKHRPEYRRMIFALSFFHSIIVERKKFHSIGWNKPYDFNDSDFSICSDLISSFMSKDYHHNADNSESELPYIPLESIRYLIGEINYGGKVTDECDQRLVNVYVNQYFNEFSLTSNYAFSSLPQYIMPEDGTLQHYADIIRALPAIDNCEVFGQHYSAELASRKNDADNIIMSLLNLEPRGLAVAESQSARNVVVEQCSKILDTFSYFLDIKLISKKYENDTNPLNIFYVQEIRRYNTLLDLVINITSDLKKGLTGQSILNEELDGIFDDFLVSKVPNKFRCQYPTTKSLGPWIKDLESRVNQLKKWYDMPPKVYWLGGIIFPAGFLTALQQNSARRNKASIDTLGWEFVIHNEEEYTIQIPPKEGVYIKGLILEAAGWDIEENCLTDPVSMEMTYQMPIIHFKPKIVEKRRALKGIYQCPLYTWQSRGLITGFPSPMLLYVDLRVGAKDSDYWIKRGTALLLSSN